jgi:hypothetical protein
MYCSNVRDNSLHSLRNGQTGSTDSDAAVSSFLRFVVALGVTSLKMILSVWRTAG